jgi:hypothetical protein
MEEQCSFFIDMEEKTGLFTPQGREEQACFHMLRTNFISAKKNKSTTSLLWTWMAEMERSSRHAPHGIAPPKHSRLAPAVAILLVLSLAFARFIRHRRRSQRSLSRTPEFKSFLCKKRGPLE